MKVIALMPVRNEALVLPSTLQCLGGFCDHIIVADQASSDRTDEIARSHPLVTVIENNAPVGQGFQHRRETLLEAFRSFDGNNVALCLDADELVSPTIFRGFGDAVRQCCKPGDTISLHWVQLWRDFYRYRDDDSVWSNSWKPMAFWDDRRMSYHSTHFLHEMRTPQGFRAPVEIAKFPVLHLQWAYWDRTQFKQAWYRSLELVEAGFVGAQGINQRYAITLRQGREETSALPVSWSEGVDFPTALMEPLPNWHRDELMSLFREYGIARFEPLQIWHIDELRDQFVKEIGRAPVSDTGQPRRRSLAFRVARRLTPEPIRAVVRQLLR